MKAIVIREKKCKIPEMNPNSHIYTYSLYLQMMESTIQSLEKHGNPVFVLSQANFALPSSGWTRTLTIDNLYMVESNIME
jgi:hypothetical protein